MTSGDLRAGHPSVRRRAAGGGVPAASRKQRCMQGEGDSAGTGACITDIFQRYRNVMALLEPVLDMPVTGGAGFRLLFQHGQVGSLYEFPRRHVAVFTGGHAEGKEDGNPAFIKNSFVV